MVSVTRDCLHANRVCHRDLKGENVLVDPESGDILILDLGLATQFSASEPKLTTCCGSPAFHVSPMKTRGGDRADEQSPEIVSALAKPPGVVTYYGYVPLMSPCFPSFIELPLGSLIMIRDRLS